jgi:3-methyladenine DNA glycosylase/8-oxoguanine DNA glycosylase
VGPWTAAVTVAVSHGDPDAVPVGDWHAKHVVAWALAGRPRGTDEEMLELLAPYAGQRRRVLDLLGRDGWAAPRFGPGRRLIDVARL